MRDGLYDNHILAEMKLLHRMACHLYNINHNTHLDISLRYYVSPADDETSLQYHITLPYVFRDRNKERELEGILAAAVNYRLVYMSYEKKDEGSI